jgi:hypothetical protein
MAQGMTKYTKRDSIMKMLKKHFPEVPFKLPIFFVDNFDLGKAHDETRDEARRIVKLCQQNSHYDTRMLRKCMDTKWRDRKDRLDTLHLKMLDDEVMQSLGK